jgi:LacI family transcriptional regulator
MKRLVTLRDIALATQLSVAAVSQGLRNNRNVSRETCRRVQAAARRMGYRPNPLLAALARHQFRKGAGRSYVPLAFLTLRDPSFGRPFLEEIETLKIGMAHAREVGYQLTHFPLDLADNFKNGGRVLYHRGVQGIILSTGDQHIPVPDWDWNLFTVVVINQKENRLPFHTAQVDHFEAIRTVWKKVRERGYRKVGWALFVHDPVIHDDRLRMAAVWSCQRETPAAERLPPLESSIDIRLPELLPWIKKHKPEVVIGFNPWICDLLVEAGYRVPHDFAFASINLLEGHLSAPNAFAGMTEARDAAFCAAVDLLNQKIRERYQGRAGGSTTILVQAEWKDGATLPIKAMLS